MTLKLDSQNQSNLATYKKMQQTSSITHYLARNCKRDSSFLSEENISNQELISNNGTLQMIKLKDEVFINRVSMEEIFFVYDFGINDQFFTLEQVKEKTDEI